MLVFVVKLQDETPHDDLAVKLSNEILSNPGSFNVRTLVRVLCSLRLSTSDENVLKDLKILCRRMLKVCLLHYSTSRIQRFNVGNNWSLSINNSVQVCGCRPSSNVCRWLPWSILLMIWDRKHSQRKKIKLAGSADICALGRDYGLSAGQPVVLPEGKISWYGWTSSAYHNKHSTARFSDLKEPWVAEVKAGQA